MRLRKYIVAGIVAVLAVFLATVSVPGQGAATQSPDDSAPPEGARIVEEGWFPPPQFKQPPESPGTVYVIPIRGDIDGILDRIVRMKATTALRNNAQTVIFDIDTFGGALDLTERIMSLINRELADVYTVAYINSKAGSAGAMMAVVCDRLIMSPDAKMGAARPVMVGPGGFVDIPAGERAKIESFFTAMVRGQAEEAGHNVTLVDAMISVDIEAWLIRNQQTGELRIVNAREWEHRLPGAPPIRQLSDELRQLTMAMQDLRDADRSNEVERSGGAAASGEWEFVRVIIAGDKLLSMTSSEAQYYGFTDAPAASIEALVKRLGGSNHVYLEDTWSQTLAMFLTHAGIQSLLFMAMIFFGYLELQEPGLGLFGGLALLCLALMLGGRYIVGLAEWWEMALIVIGLLLIGLEIFVIPGFGVAGISGLVLVVAGLLFTAVPAAPGELPLPTTEAARHYLREGLLVLLIGMVGAVVLGVLFMRHVKRLPFGSKIVLADVPTFDEPPAPDDSPIHSVQVGDIGLVESTLRPVGKVRINNALCDAAAESAFIESGARVRVLQRDGNRLIVEKVDGD